MKSEFKPKWLSQGISNKARLVEKDKYYLQPILGGRETGQLSSHYNTVDSSVFPSSPRSLASHSRPLKDKI